MKNSTNKKIEAIDLFCGIGGLSCGLQKAGIIISAGLDLDTSCKYAYETNINAKFIAADIANYDFAQLNSYYSPEAIRVLVGCAPCQPFSSHSHKVKNKEINDDRWNLISHFIRAVKTLNPTIISMENVRGIIHTQIFKMFVEELEQLGFSLDYKIVFCPDYGIPQNRSRLVLLGNRQGKISIPKKTHTKDNYLTVNDAIKKCASIKAGETDSNDPVHRSKNLMPINIQRIRQSIPHGTWKDWDTSLLPNCYRKESGQTYSSVYGRMSWDKQSPTITTQFFNYGSGRFGHPEQDRALSLREGAILQTFPIDYDFGTIVSLQTLGKHVGNAVPPRLGEVIGKQIINNILEDKL